MTALSPMLVATARDWPTGRGWVLEPKWDGYRLVAAVKGGRGRCWTRHATELTAGAESVMRELVEVFPEDSVVDGELVVLGVDGGGRVGQDFNRVGRAVFGGGHDLLSFVVFDVASRVRPGAR